MTDGQISRVAPRPILVMALAGRRAGFVNDRVRGEKDDLGAADELPHALARIVLKWASP
jgi:hypothetical protein